ncbi:MAG: hypothetical protein H6838_20525 [Planctomycetes bacterium]|nr:hypothetical protein [Planctomycetota bacterium]MCB9887877.1 hypothetical protein [Planctomycetota bacterium]
MSCPRAIPALLVPLGLALAAGCHRSAPPAFEVMHTSPVLGGEAGPLLLNDTITVYFSAPVSALSVTSDSVHVVDARGNQVPGQLRVGENWVTFAPRPPLTAGLVDGSFQPGEAYELRLAGYPRPDAIRAVDGRRLSIGHVLPFRAADVDHREGGLPAPLRPLASDLPLVLRAAEAPQALPVDAAVLRLHFSSPLLPTSVTPSALVIQSLRDMATLTPRRVRAVTSAVDLNPGSSVEVELGATPAREDGGFLALQPGDLISVSLRMDADGLRDYQGNTVLPAPPQFWTVVPGATVALLELPGAAESFVDEGSLEPGFEVRGGVVRPRVRVEAGDGSLGAFRPQQDTVLRPGEPFDRGDGVQVASRDGRFPFRLIEVPRGVTVTLDCRGGPVQLTALGSVSILGELALRGAAVPLAERQLAPVPAASLFDLGAPLLLAAGDVHLSGRVVSDAPAEGDATPFVVAAAGHVHLGGELPFRTVLAVEAAHAGGSGPAVHGPRGQTLLRSVEFTYGLAPGATCEARGFSAWQQLPEGRIGGVVQVRDADAELRLAWQSTPPDAIVTDAPDLTPGRTGRLQTLFDGEPVTIAERAFVRFAFEASLRHDRRLPSLRMLRLVAR